MRKNVYFKRIKQSILATAVAVCCVVGCDNVELSFADTATMSDATMSDATLSDATAGDADWEDGTDPVGEDTGGNSVVLNEGKSREDCDTVCAELSESNALREIPEQSVDESALQTKKYEGEYNIDYILSHYSYFVEQDLTGDYVADTVGPVIVGNCLDLKNTVGKVKAAASYVKYLIDLADYYAGAWNDTTGVDVNFYYTESRMTYKEWLTNRMVKVADGYIDMSEAFAQIKRESDTLAQSGNSGYVENGDLIVDFSKGTAITLSDKDYKMARRIILKNVTAEDILANSYIISITGDSDFELDTSRILIGDTALNNNYFFNYVNNRQEAVQGGQYYNGQFGLIWNFPDAKNVTAKFLAGHLVAPIAKVSLTGGNHEGQVIARTVNSSSESHFYPYNVTTEQPPTTEQLPTTEQSATTEQPPTEQPPTTEQLPTIEQSAAQPTGRQTLVIPRASSTATQVQTTLAEEHVQTGDTMALGIVITLFVLSAGFILLFVVLKENKKK